MSFLIPHERWTLRSPLLPSKALERLAGQVEPPRLRLPWQKCASPFEGYVIGRRFILTRANRGRSEGQPVIVGETHDDPAGSRFEITFRIRRSILAFLILVALLSAGSVLYEHKIDGLIIGVVFGAIANLTTRLTFFPEMRRSQVLLAQALGAPRQAVPPRPPSWLEPEDD